MWNEYEVERERCLEQEALTQGEYMGMAMRQYAADRGSRDVERAWILTDFDTWEANPYYEGKPVPHPEDACWDDPDFEYDAEWSDEGVF